MKKKNFELWDKKTSLATDMISNGIVSSEWVYKNIYGFTEEEIVEMD